MNAHHAQQSTQTYRVAQWTTGNIGLRALRALIEHPQVNLVGVHVFSDDKVGKDAGELVGLKPVGVKATKDIESILALKPDCVIYTAQRTDLNDVCRLLEAGANVIASGTDFLYPPAMNPAVREKIEAACQRGGSSIHSTGASPGFVTEALPVVLASLQRRLDCLTIDEFADLSKRLPPDMIYRVMGYGTPPGEFSPAILHHIQLSFMQSLHLLADSFGIPFDSVEAKGELATTPKTIRIAAGEIAAGTVAAMRMTVSGMRNGRPLMRFRANWYVTTEIEPHWDLRDTGWRIAVEGDTPLNIDIRFPIKLEELAGFTPKLTAHRVINAIPYVCAAAPGIRTSLDMPQMVVNLAEAQPD